MRVGGQQILFFCCLIVFSVSCSKFRKIQKSEDWRIKYEAALNYYKAKDYYRAAILFEEVRPITRGLPEGEQVEFYLAYCQYNEKTYLLASNQFQSFYITYGRSALAEEAHFMYAYSLYAASPDYNLDQQSSVEAMIAMQNFINQYPRSEYLERAVEVITECQQKLERKNFENAKLYLKLRYYKAALVAFDTFKANFPDSEYLEEVAYLKVVAQFQLAEQSFLRLQLERYTAVIEFYQELADSYPSSKFLKEVEELYSESLSQVNKIKTENS